MSPSTIADSILLLHCLFILGVIVPVPLVLIGAWRKWGWVRNIWFRLAHLGMIMFVTLQTWAGIMCPLTVWENHYRKLAGQQGYGESFIAYWLRKVIFHPLPLSYFAVVYTGFALLILSLFWIAPIRWNKANKPCQP